MIAFSSSQATGLQQEWCRRTSSNTQNRTVRNQEAGSPSGSSPKKRAYCGRKVTLWNLKRILFFAFRVTSTYLHLYWFSVSNAKTSSFFSRSRHLSLGLESTSRYCVFIFYCCTFSSIFRKRSEQTVRWICIVFFPTRHRSRS